MELLLKSLQFLQGTTGFQTCDPLNQISVGLQLTHNSFSPNTQFDIPGNKYQALGHSADAHSFSIKSKVKLHLNQGLEHSCAVLRTLLMGSLQILAASKLLLN